MWSVEYVPNAVKERDALPDDMRAKLYRMLDTIGRRGFTDLPRDWVKPLGDRLWELRITGKDGIARAIYIKAKADRLIIVRIFIKKTQKTPPQEIALARQRAKEVE